MLSGFAPRLRFAPYGERDIRYGGNMKKIWMLSVFAFALLLPVYGRDEYASNVVPELTSEQIRQHAYELGVPYEALRQLVDAHRTPTLSNPNAEGATFISFRELDFMRASDMLSEGSYYIVYAWYFSQRGRTVFLDASAQDSSILSFDTNFLVDIPERSNVIALIGVRADSFGRPRELYIVELALR